LRGLRLGQAALDLRGALVEDRLELRQDGLVEHDRDDDQDHGRPQQVVPGGEEELDALVLLARLRRDVERGGSQRRHQNRKPATRPSSASTSTNATPMNIVARSCPATSGWRAMPSMVLPIRMPRPMPGPIAARP